MTNDSGALSFDAVIRDTDFKKQIDEIQRRITGMADQTQRETSRMDTAFKTLGAGIAGYFSFQALKGFATQLFNVRGEFEQLEVAFTTMLRSKQRADALMKDVVHFAATTPFELQDVAKGTKQLLAYGFAADGITDNLRVLGDVAAGVGAPIGDLVYLYGTLRTQGRAYTRDIMQFTSRGIPIIAALAEQLGVAESEVQALVEAGKVGFPEVEKAFQSMTAQGGIFNNLMAEQSKTLLGQWSNLKDAIEQAINEIGQETDGLFAAGIKSANFLVENYETIGKVLLTLISTYGAYRAALMVSAAAQTLNVRILRAAVSAKREAAAQNKILTASEAKGIAIKKLFSAATIKQTAAQWGLNAAILANPYVAATAALVGLGVALYTFSNRTTAAERAQKALNAVLNEQREKLEDEVRLANEHIAILKDENETRLKKTQAYKELVRLMPEVFAAYSKEELMMMSLAELQQLINQGRDVKSIKGVQDAYDGQIRKIEELKVAIQKLNEEGTNISSGGMGVDSRIAILSIQLKEAEAQAEALRKKIIELQQEEFDSKPAAQRLKYYKEQTKEIQRQLIELTGVVGTVEFIAKVVQGMPKMWGRIDITNLITQFRDYERKIQALSKDDSILTVGEKIKELTANIAKEEAKLKELRKESSLVDTEAIQKAEDNIKSYKDQLKLLGVDQKKPLAPFGSIEYWEEVAKKAEEAFNLTPSTNQAELQKQLNIKLDAEKKIEEIRAQFSKKTLDEELDYKRKQYQLYQRWVEYIGQEQADNQFKTLIESGKTYVEFLTRQVEQLEQRQKAGELSAEDANKLISYKSSLSEAKGEKSAIDEFKDSLNKAKQEATTLTEYLDILKKKQQELADNTTDFGMAARREIAEREIEAQEERAQRLQEFLNTTKTIEQQELDITKYYSDLREEVVKQANAGKIKNAEDAIQKINNAEREALAEIRKPLLETSEYYQKLFGDISDYGYRTLKELSERTSQILESAKGGIDEDGRKFFMIDIVSIDKEGKAVKETVKLTLEEFRRFKEQLNEINRLTREKNPFAAIAESYTAMVEAFSSGDNDKLVNAIENFEEATAKSLETLNQWGEALGAIFGDRVQYAINNISELAKGLSNVGTGVARLYSGDAVGGITSIVQGIASIATIWKRTKEMNREARQSIREFYEEAERGELRYQALLRQRERDRVAAGKTTYQALVAEMELLEKQSDEVQAAYDKVFAALQGQDYVEGKGYKRGTWLGKAKPVDIMASLAGADYDRMEQLYEQGKLKDTAKEDFEALRALREELEAAGIDVQELQQQINELLTGTSTSALADQLVDMFRSGKTAAKDFADSFEEIIKTAIVNTFKYQYLEQQMQPFFDMIAEAAADGTISDSEINNARTFYTNLAQASADTWKAIEEATGFDFSDTAKPQGLQGAIKGVSEETAGVIAGQMNAVRINQVESTLVIKSLGAEIISGQTQALDLTRQSLLHLAEIAANTRYNKHLESIDKKLDKLNSDPLRAQGL